MFKRTLIERLECGCYNSRSRFPRFWLQTRGVPHELSFDSVSNRSGQVAQVVERSPEKAGVGGSTPSLATITHLHIFALTPAQRC